MPTKHYELMINKHWPDGITSKYCGKKLNIRARSDTKEKLEMELVWYDESISGHCNAAEEEGDPEIEGKEMYDKDGGHVIRSAISENPMLHANFTALCFSLYTFSGYSSCHPG